MTVTTALTINPAFQSFIAPLSESELQHLEDSILREGLRDPIVIWQGQILDGHHRYGICQKHGLPFQTFELILPDEEAAKLWMVDNQLGRRNISPFYRCELALAKEAILKEQGRARMSVGGQESARVRAEQRAAQAPDAELDRQQGLAKSSNLEQKWTTTRGQLAFEACVGENTLYKVRKVLQHGSPDVIDRARREFITVNQAYNEVRKALKPKPTLPPEEPGSLVQQLRKWVKTECPAVSAYIQGSVYGVVARSHNPEAPAVFDVELRSLTAEQVKAVCAILQPPPDPGMFPPTPESLPENGEAEPRPELVPELALDPGPALNQEHLDDQEVALDEIEEKWFKNRILRVVQNNPSCDLHDVENGCRSQERAC